MKFGTGEYNLQKSNKPSDQRRLVPKDQDLRVSDHQEEEEVIEEDIHHDDKPTTPLINA
jgi:hypothetical protein